MQFLLQAFRAKAVRLANAAAVASGGTGSSTGGTVSTVGGDGNGEGSFKPGVIEWNLQEGLGFTFQITCAVEIFDLSERFFRK